MNKLSSKLKSFTAGIFALACFSLPANANADVQCKHNYTNVVVTVVGYGAVCPRGYSIYRGNPFERRGQSNPYADAMNTIGQNAARQLNNAFYSGSQTNANKPSQHDNSRTESSLADPSVKAKLKQIREIDALQNSGSISKSQADQLKAELLR